MIHAPRILALLALSTGVHASLGVQQPTPNERHAKVFDKTVDVMKQSAYLPGVTKEQFDKLVIEARQKIVDAPDDFAFLRQANQLFDGMGFSHIQLMSPDQAKRQQTGKMVGLGVELRFLPDGLPEIMYVFPGSGADSIGMIPGDIILEIDGAKYDRERGASGTPGTTFSVKYKSRNGETHTRRVIRKEFNTTKPVEARMLDEHTGYLRVWSFAPYAPRAVKEGYEKLSKAQNLILDLRSNGGGSVFWMMDFMAYFINPDIKIGSFQSKGEKDGELVDRPSVIANRDRKRFKGSMVVLVDEGSASASEITAAAFQETGRALIVGRKSRGAVLASTYVPVGEGFMVQIPIQDYKTMSGTRLEGHGVKPDVEVSEDQIRPLKPSSPDETIEIARKVLAGEIKPPVKTFVP